MFNLLPDPSSFDKTLGTKQVHLFTLANDSGMMASVTNYGARLVSLLVPFKAGELVDVVAGYNSLQEYLDSSEPYHGAIIGRFCNRIKKGRFMLNEQEYKLTANDDPNSLHGGEKGFHQSVWDATQISANTVEFSYLSKDMEEGYPGNLAVKVVYLLTKNNEIKITYTATTDRLTVLNLTNHAYFNLNGVDAGSIVHHKVQIKADSFTAINKEQIPTGEILNVKESPFDFKRGCAVNARIYDYDQQLKFGNGYNHNFVLNRHGPDTSVANIIGDKSGIKMEVFTDQPGLQFYTGNHFRGENIIKAGNRDYFRSFFAMETQHFPDSPNHDNFPPTTLKPGQLFSSFTIYRFSIDQGI